jgi:hypothetical protein
MERDTALKLASIASSAATRSTTFTLASCIAKASATRSSVDLSSLDAPRSSVLRLSTCACTHVLYTRLGVGRVNGHGTTPQACRASRSGRCVWKNAYRSSSRSRALADALGGSAAYVVDDDSLSNDDDRGAEGGVTL